MSIAPIFGNLKKIIFKSDKEKKEFIEDLLYISIAKSMLQTTLQNNIKLDERVITYQKNKYRKSKQKIQECTDYIVEELWKVIDRLTDLDTMTLQHKILQATLPYVEVLASKEKKSLELVAIALLDHGLRRKRKTLLREELQLFTNYKFLYHKLGKSVEEAGIREMDIEIELAQEIVKKIKYNKLK